MSSEQLSDEAISPRKHDSPRKERPLNVVVTSAAEVTPAPSEPVATTPDTAAGTHQQTATQATQVSQPQSVAPLAVSDGAVALPHPAERERTMSISLDNTNPVVRRLVRSHTRIQTSEPESKLSFSFDHNWSVLELARVAKAQGKMRQHVANELLQTERSYVRSLTMLADVSDFIGAAYLLTHFLGSHYSAAQN